MNLKSIAEQNPELIFFDAHYHLVDFRQNPVNIQDLEEAMQANNVYQMACFGLPVKKKKVSQDKSTYYMTSDERVYNFSATDDIAREILADLPPLQRSKFHLGICGFNPCDFDAVDQVYRLLDKYPGVYRFIGEIFSHHDYLTALQMDQEIPRINHPALLNLYKNMLTRKDLFPRQKPIFMVHHNLGTSVRGEAFRFVAELDNALGLNPGLTFIIPHLGYTHDLREHNKGYYPEKIRELLKAHHNLFFDISWMVFDELICADLPVWSDIFREFPDRFMIGTDKLAKTSSDKGFCQINNIYYYLTLNKDNLYMLTNSKDERSLSFGSVEAFEGSTLGFSSEVVNTIIHMIPEMENYSRAINKYLTLRKYLDQTDWEKLAYGNAANIFSE